MAFFCSTFRLKSSFNLLRQFNVKYLHTQAAEASKTFIPSLKETPPKECPQSEGITSGLNIKIEDKPGSLKKILEVFEADNINLTDIHTKSLPLVPSCNAFDVFFNDDKSKTKSKKIKQILETKFEAKVEEIQERTTPWFPQSETDLELLNAKTIHRDDMLGSDHPGVHDVEYIQRRDEIARISSAYKSGPLPYIEYSESENKTWAQVFPKLFSLYTDRACVEFLLSITEFLELGIYRFDRIPQMRDVSNYLTSKTGYKLRPVTGLLDGRDFLNALAFKNFFATQYIRHPSKPFYTPEPDVIHELLGHCSLLANKEFAEFTQLIGLASLGANDEQIELLTHLYWYTNEFGLLFQDNKLKAYGAGILSSIEELDLATRPSNKCVKIYEFSPYKASKQPFDFKNLQNVYFAAKSLVEIRDKCIEFTQEFLKPFSIKYNVHTNSVKLSTSVRCVPIALQFNSK